MRWYNPPISSPILRVAHAYREVLVASTLRSAEHCLLPGQQHVIAELSVVPSR
jgi:hypothetical protein